LTPTTQQAPEAPPSQTPLGVYLHTPWCVHKCPYCDFNSHRLRGRVPAHTYVEALLRDLDHALPRLQGRPVATVFIGGGTPSLFPAADVERLLDGLFARLAPLPWVEITLEANPDSADQARFRGYRRAGVNRLSIGVQSLDDNLLTAIGRCHDARAARAAVSAARDAGFDNLNLDLMYGLPGQTPQGSLRELREAAALQPEHLSWYQLTLEPDTLFYRQPPTLPAAAAVAHMETARPALLAAAGYVRHDVSAHARAGHACLHNRNYWEFGDYLGLGAGAHGKLSGRHGVYRERRLRSPARYLATAGSEQAIAARRSLQPADLELEFLLNALRLLDGFPEALFTTRTGASQQRLHALLAPARAAGLVEFSEHRVRASRRGLRYLDEILAGLPGPRETEPRLPPTGRGSESYPAQPGNTAGPAPCGG